MGDKEAQESMHGMGWDGMGEPHVTLFPLDTHAYLHFSLTPEASRQQQEGGSTGEEGPDSAHDTILGAVLTKDVGPLLQAINNFCRG